VRNRSAERVRFPRRCVVSRGSVDPKFALSRSRMKGKPVKNPVPELYMATLGLFGHIRISGRESSLPLNAYVGGVP